MTIRSEVRTYVYIRMCVCVCMQAGYPQGGASECIILFRQGYCMSGVVVVDGANWDEELLQVGG